MLKAIHAQEDIQTARATAEQVAIKLEQMKLAKAAQIVRNGIEETLSFYNFPSELALLAHQQPAGYVPRYESATKSRHNRVTPEHSCP